MVWYMSIRVLVQNPNKYPSFAMYDFSISMPHRLSETSQISTKLPFWKYHNSGLYLGCNKLFLFGTAISLGFVGYLLTVGTRQIADLTKFTLKECKTNNRNFQEMDSSFCCLQSFITLNNPINWKYCRPFVIGLWNKSMFALRVADLCEETTANKEILWLMLHSMQRQPFFPIRFVWRFRMLSQLRLGASSFLRRTSAKNQKM